MPRGQLSENGGCVPCPCFYRKEPGNAVSAGSIYENLWQFQVF